MFSLSTATFEDLHSIIRDLGSGFHRLDLGGRIQVYNTLNQVNFFENKRPIGNILFPANKGLVMFAPVDMNGAITYDNMDSVPADTRIVDTAWPKSFGIRAKEIDAMVVELITNAVKIAKMATTANLIHEETDQQGSITFTDVCRRMSVGRIPKAICKKFDGLTAKTNGPRELTVRIDSKPFIDLVFHNDANGELRVALFGYSSDEIGTFTDIQASTNITEFTKYPQYLANDPNNILADIRTIVGFLTEVVRS